MTKQTRVMVIGVSHDVDNESIDEIGKPIKSPAFMPYREWHVPEPISLPAGALSIVTSAANGDNTNDALVAKPSSPHKLSKAHKFPSMTNLYQAAEDCEEAAVPSSPPKTPHSAPFDKAHNSEWGENFGGPATSEAKDNHASGSCGSPKALTLDHTVGTVPSWSKMKKSRSVVDVTHLEDGDGPKVPAGSAVSVDPIPSSVAEDRPGRSLLFVLDMDHTMVGNLVALSDRDNIETNIEWNYWPSGSKRGLSVEDIIPYLEVSVVPMNAAVLVYKTAVRHPVNKERAQFPFDPGPR